MSNLTQTTVAPDRGILNSTEKNVEIVIYTIFIAFLVSTRVRTNSGSTETTDSVISSAGGNDTPKSTNLERTSSGRSVQPPSTLDLPLRSDVTHNSAEGFPAEHGMRSDDTLVNGDFCTDDKAKIAGKKF